MLNFIPLLLVGLILIITLHFSKKSDDKINFIPLKFAFILLLIPFFIAGIIAFIMDFNNSIYGGSFNPPSSLLTWMFLRTSMNIAPFTFLILFGIFVYCFSDQYLPIGLKYNVLFLATIALSIVSVMGGIFLYPTNIAYLEAYNSLMVDVINLILTITMNLAILIIYMSIRPFPGHESKKGALKLTSSMVFDFYYDYKLLSYFKNAFVVIPIVIGVIFFVFHNIINSGLAIYLGGIFSLIPFVIIVILTLISIPPLYGIYRLRKRSYMTFITVVLILVILIIPSIMSFNDINRDLQSASTALEDVKISSEPLNDYPINLDNIRLVDRALAQDIADSIKLPEPPKSYRVNVLDEYQEIGYINGEASWIVPIRYNEIIGNPETNYIAGYIGINLNDPIPEDSVVKYSEMSVGPGLSGYRDIQWVIKQEHPDSLVGNIYLVDPWANTGKPAWVVILDKLTPWGVRESNILFVVQADGKTETLTREQALADGLTLINSDESIKSVIDHATAYLRKDTIDPSSRGFLWLPASPDVQNTIGGDFFSSESSFYYDVHHFLLPNKEVGRERYMTVSTGTKESIVVWTAINQTLEYYDMRYYSKGGISGVNSPTQAFSNLQQTTSSAGYSSYSIRYPKLYKIDNLIGNNTLLIWVSVVVEVRSGADRFAGMAFVDAANPRFSKFLSAQLGEQPATFKARFKEAINQTYLGFASNGTIGGETLTKDFVNATVIGKEWAYLKPNNIYANVLLMKEFDGTESFVIVTENSVATKNDFYTAAIAQPGDQLTINARWDSDAQGWLAVSVKFT